MNGDSRSDSLRRSLLQLFTTGAAVGILLSVTALMALFMGSRSADLDELLGALRIWCIVGLVFSAWSFGTLHAGAARSRLRTLWLNLPAWLVVLVAGLLILGALAVLAVAMIERITGESTVAGHYISVLALCVSCLALTVGLASQRSRDPDVPLGPRRHLDPGHRSGNT